MRIESSQLAYQADHRLEIKHTTLTRTIELARAPAIADSVSLSRAGSSPVGPDVQNLEDLDPKQQVAILALEAILGHRFARRRGASAGGGAPSGGPAAAAPVRLRQVTETHAESERTTFQAAGTVETSDGRSISFTASLEMRREFYSRSSETTLAPVTDPLVVNLNGGPARLSNATVSFDLNSDGTKEQIHFAASGSGFLALDANQDGRINNGSELFGPQTGNGFAELAAFDADQNQWIDEADPVFSRLRVWTQSGLYSLADAGIGAISTTAAETPFSLKDASNQLQGQVRATAAYLKEDGTPGTVQQVDLVSG